MHLASLKLAAKDARTPTGEEFVENLEGISFEVDKPFCAKAKYKQPSVCWPAEPLINEDTDDVFPGNMVDSFVKEHGLEKATQMCNRPPISVEKPEMSKLRAGAQEYTDSYDEGPLRWKMRDQFVAWCRNQVEGVDIISLQGKFTRNLCSILVC